MSFVSMSKASVVQPDKRFTLPLKGEALSPKKLVDEKDNPPQPSSSLYIAAGKGNTADRSRYQPYGHH